MTSLAQVGSSDNSTQEARSPLTPAADTPPDADAPVEPCGAKMKKFGKILLDSSPSLIGIGFGFVGNSSFAVALLCWCTVGIAIVALAVDFVHVRRRLAKGLEAEFPKLIPVTFLLMMVIVLGLTYSGVLKVEEIKILNGCFVTGGLFLASATSVLIGKPWIYAVAVEGMSPTRLQEIKSQPRGMEVFMDIMNAITWLWTATFLLMFCLSLSCTMCLIWGDINTRTAASITTMVGSTLITVLALKCVQPKVIETAKEKSIERIRASAEAANSA